MVILKFNIDVSVLENFHVSETFKILLKDGNKNNPFEKLSPAQFRTIRRRMIECILATDMAFHNKRFTEITKLVEANKIKNGQNLELIITDNTSKNIEVQQTILSECVHTADLSSPAKVIEVCSKCTELVYSEFFHQGDVELANNPEKPNISFLCDRKTTNISKSQIGFITFVVYPQFEMITNILPELDIYLVNITKNKKYYEKELEKESSIKKELENNK